MQFPDGQLPNNQLLKKWLLTVDDFFSQSKSFQSTTQLGSPTNQEKSGSHLGAVHKFSGTDSQKHDDPFTRIGVHCVAGLGRAPFFVSMALVNNGCSAINAIELIRKNRPGSLNITQANYILNFK
jgi:hypothetical protein